MVSSVQTFQCFTLPSKHQSRIYIQGYNELHSPTTLFSAYIILKLYSGKFFLYIVMKSDSDTRETKNVQYQRTAAATECEQWAEMMQKNLQNHEGRLFLCQQILPQAWDTAQS